MTSNYRGQSAYGGAPQKNSPLIEKEITRWHDLLWDDIYITNGVYLGLIRWVSPNGYRLLFTYVNI